VDGIEEEEEDARCCSKLFVGELLIPNNSSSYPNDVVVAPSLGENPPLAFPRLLNDALLLLLSSEDRTTLLSLIFPADEADVVFAEEEEEVEEPLIKFSLMFPKKKSNTPPPPPPLPTSPSLSLSDIKKPPPVSFLSRPSLSPRVIAVERERERERNRELLSQLFSEKKLPFPFFVRDSDFLDFLKP